MRRIAFAWGLVVVGAVAARADIELPAEPAPPPQEAPAQDRDIYGDESPAPYGPPGGEVLDGPPPEIDTHPVFRGARNDPPYFGINATLYVGELDSEMEYEKDGSGNLVRSTSDLPIEEEAAAISLEAWIQLGDMWVVNMGVFGTGAEEEGAVQRSFVHAGQRFDRGDEVEVELTQGLFWIGARILAVNEGNLKFGIPFGAVWTYQELRIKHQGAPDESEAEGTVEQWSPYLGLYMDVYLGYGFGIETELKFFAWGEDDETLFGYFDADAKFYCTIADHVRLFVGARAIAVDYVKDGRANDRQSNWRFAGLQVGASIYF